MKKNINENDINYETVRRAHYWNSFSPEKLAKRAQEDYANTMNRLYEKFKPLAKNPESEKILLNGLENYKNKYLKLKKI